MARSGTVAVLLPGAFYVLREQQAAAGRCAAPSAGADRDRDRQQPRHVADHVAPPDPEHGGNAVPAHRRGGRRGRHPRGGTCDRPAAGDRHARGGQEVRPRHLGASSGRPSWSIGSASTPCIRGCADDRHADPGPHDARRLARGRRWRACQARSGRDAGGRGGRAARSTRSLRKGEPVYGINTGFGRLASIHIASEDLAALQRNIVLSHAAGVGEPMRNVRLMMALKLASLGRGASGVRPGTLGMLEVHAGPRRDSDRAEPRLGRGVRRSGAARAPRGGHDRHRRGRAFGGERMPAAAALARASLAPLVLGPKEGLALLNGTQFSTAEALAGLFAIERVFQAALVTGALSTDAAKGSDTPFDARIHALRGHRGQIEVAAALRRLMAGSSIRASHLVGDDRIQDPYCLRCQPQVMGAVLDLAAAGRGDAGDRGERGHRQSPDRGGYGAVRRQLSRRAGRVRRRHARDRRCARSVRSPSGASPC